MVKEVDRRNIPLNIFIMVNDEYQTQQFWNMKKSELKNIIKEEIRDALGEVYGMEKLKQRGEEFLAQDPDYVERERRPNKMITPPKSITILYDDRRGDLYSVKVDGRSTPDPESIFKFINRLTGLDTNFSRMPLDSEFFEIQNMLKGKGIDFQMTEFDAS